MLISPSTGQSAGCRPRLVGLLVQFSEIVVLTGAECPDDTFPGGLDPPIQGASREECDTSTAFATPVDTGGCDNEVVSPPPKSKADVRSSPPPRAARKDSRRRKKRKSQPQERESGQAAPSTKDDVKADVFSWNKVTRTQDEEREWRQRKNSKKRGADKSASLESSAGKRQRFDG
jgi:hypothetical protein